MTLKIIVFNHQKPKKMFLKKVFLFFSLLGFALIGITGEPDYLPSKTGEVTIALCRSLKITDDLTQEPFCLSGKELVKYLDKTQFSIPKVLHRVWIGKKPKAEVIEGYKKNAQECKEYGYQLKIWTDHNIKDAFDEELSPYISILDMDKMDNFIKFYIDKKLYPQAKDIIILNILFEEGGAYLDSDYDYSFPNIDNDVSHAASTWGLYTWGSTNNEHYNLSSDPGYYVSASKHPFLYEMYQQAKQLHTLIMENSGLTKHINAMNSLIAWHLIGLGVTGSLLESMCYKLNPCIDSVSPSNDYRYPLKVNLHPDAIKILKESADFNTRRFYNSPYVSEESISSFMNRNGDIHKCITTAIFLKEKHNYSLITEHLPLESDYSSSYKYLLPKPFCEYTEQASSRLSFLLRALAACSCCVK